MTTGVEDVLIYGVPAYIAALGSAAAMVIGALNRQSLRTPSGDRIGAVAERTHDLAAVGVAAVTGTNGPAVDKAVERINADTSSSLTIDPAALEAKA